MTPVGSFAYVQCDIPEGVTLAEHRLAVNARRRAEQQPSTLSALALGLLYPLRIYAYWTRKDR